MRIRLQALLSGTAIVAALATAGWASNGAMQFAKADPITSDQQAALTDAMKLGDVQAALNALPDNIRTQVTNALSNATTTEGFASTIGDILASADADLNAQIQTAVGAVVNAQVNSPAFETVSENLKSDVTDTLQQKNITVSENLQPTGSILSNVKPAAGIPGNRIATSKKTFAKFESSNELGSSKSSLIKNVVKYVLPTPPVS